MCNCQVCREAEEKETQDIQNADVLRKDFLVTVEDEADGRYERVEEIISSPNLDEAWEFALSTFSKFGCVLNVVEIMPGDELGDGRVYRY